MSVLSRAQKSLRKLLGNPGLTHAIDRFIVSLEHSSAGEKRNHLVLAPPGAGNNGDLAMVQATLEALGGDVVLITKGEHDYSPEELVPAPALVLALPGLVYGAGPKHWIAVARFAKLLRSARSFSVLGADTMDGAYSVVASWNRSVLLRVAAEIGVSSRVLGFSWNNTPDKAALNALRRASVSGAELFVRDGDSLRRLKESAVSRLTQVADTVFTSSKCSREVTGHLPRGFDWQKRFVVLNLSGLIERKRPQKTEYGELLAQLARQSIQVLLVPHVVKEMSDDLDACRSLLPTPSPGVFLVEQILPPAVLRTLTAKADLVITGRMHLAVLALSSGCPVIVLSTQGKVEGLLRYFDMTDSCIEPEPGYGRQVLSVADRILSDQEVYRSRVRRHLPAVQALSWKNFESLVSLKTPVLKEPS